MSVKQPDLNQTFFTEHFADEFADDIADTIFGAFIAGIVPGGDEPGRRVTISLAYRFVQYGHLCELQAVLDRAKEIMLREAEGDTPCAPGQ